MPVAYPLPQYHWLDENTEAALYLYGDEFLNWFTDERGNVIISTRDGELHYARWHNEFNAFEPLEELTPTSLADRLDETKHPNVLIPPVFDIRREIVTEYRRHYRNPDQIPDPTKPELCSSCPTAGVCDPMCESAHTCCSGSCMTCTCCPTCPEGEEAEEEIPDPFVLRPVPKGSIVRPILPIYVRFKEDADGCPRMDLPNYYIEDQLIATEKFQTLANYYDKQTNGAVKLVNLGIHYVRLETPPRNYSQHLDEVYDDIVYPALQMVSEQGVNFFKYRRCCDKYRPCRIDPTTCTPLFIVHGYELSEGGIGPGVWGHSRWGLGKVNVNGHDFDFDTYMVVGAFQMAYAATVAASDCCHCATFIQPGTLVHEAGHALFYLQDLYDADGPSTIESDKPSDPKADVLFIVDESGSMSPEQATLKSEIGVFANSLSSTVSDWQIGVLGYAGSTSPRPHRTSGGDLWATDISEAQYMANQLVHDGGAATHGNAITYALENYPWRDGARYIVLITDAENEGGSVTVADAAVACTSYRVHVYTIVSDAFKDYFEPLWSMPNCGQLELSNVGTWGAELSTTIVPEIGTIAALITEDSVPCFGMWSPMSYGNWGMSKETCIPAELPTNMDAYSLYQINPRLTVPQWQSGSKTIVNPYTPHSMMLFGETTTTLTPETYLFQLRDYREYDEGILGFWSVAGFLDLSNDTDLARVRPGILVVHDRNMSRVPVLYSVEMPADVHEAHAYMQNLRCLPDSTYKNYADPEDLFGNTMESFGDSLVSPDNLMVSVRKGLVAGFDATSMTFIPEGTGAIGGFGNKATYDLSIDTLPPVAWNDLSKCPDDPLKPKVPEGCTVNTWCYFGTHFQCTKCGGSGTRRLYRNTNN